MKYRVLCLAATTIIVAGCAGRPTPLPEVDSAAATLYAARCGGCHAVPHPKRHKPSQWERTVNTMEREMELKGVPSLTDNERSSILSYLKRHGR